MAVRKTNLTQKVVDAASVKRGDKTLWDTTADGLGLKVTATGRRTYIFKYKSPDGRRRSMTLGPATKLSLDAARNETEGLTRKVSDGGDPAADRRNANYFKKDKYVIVLGMIDPSIVEVAYQYAFMLRNGGGLFGGDLQVPGTPNFYGDTLMETLLEKLLPNVEVATGLDLYPTYSYMRIYKSGDVLKRHKDRGSCEISLTIPLGFEGDDCWPIQADNGDHTVVANLQPGDAMVYRGCDISHWREEFTGKHQVQVFLHYVDQNGPYANQKFDFRPGLGYKARV